MKTLRHVVSMEENGRLVKNIVRGRMGVSHRLFSQVKFSGGLLLDGERVFATAVVRAGQTVELILPGDAADTDAAGSVNIVYEDDDIFIVNKQAPLPCQSSERQPGDTLEARMKPLMPGAVFRPVNRLDKGTSGLMLVARHAHAQDVMQRRLHTEDFVREYRAIVIGAPEEDCGIIDAPIRKADGATIRREVAPDGKPSRTHYQVEKRGELSIVRLRLETGRTHQIRVHMAHMGCPVFGDFLYGAEDERLPGRFALHSAYISFFHPETGERMEFSAPLPEELLRLVQPGETNGM
ncbi:MAG: RluA family pseudouridine synthase [Clostridiales bacterium]|nr:RluA family pseudouridine synthase [Clostridiales bacterium]